MKRKNSIVSDLAALQQGVGRKSIYRLRCQIQKKIIISSNREYQKIHTFQSRGPSMFTLLHCGRFLFHHKNRVQCYSAFEKSKKLKLYNFPVKYQCKDLIVWSPDSPLSTETLVSNNARHSTSLLYVTSTHYLHRRCALSGELCDKVFLSSSIKFTEIQCDPESVGLIVLKSTKHTRNDGIRFLTFAIFSSPPLKFIAMFEVNKSVFGKKAVDAGIQQGLLFVRYQDDIVKLYSLQHILSEHTQLQCNLGDELAGFGVVGKKPAGLPLTVTIDKEPPVLMEKFSTLGDFTIGGNPWHFITKNGITNSEVYVLSTNRKITSVHTPNADSESEHVFFHPDESNRIVHISDSFLKISWLKENSIEQWFEYNAVETKNSLSSEDPQVSRFGRQIKSRIVKNSDTDDHNQDLCITYDSDTDLISILKVSPGKNDNNQLTMDKILFVDNVNGEIVRTIDLQKFPVKTPFETSSFSLLIDGVNLLAITRHQDQTVGTVCSLVEKIE